MAHDVFISYSSQDQKIAEGLSAYLEQNGIRCFVAYRDIPKGIVWAEMITDAIENCRLMIVVFSEHFNRSKHVDREIEMCIEEEKPILTFKIQNADFQGAKKYFLKNLNWIDAFPNPQEYFGEVLKSIRSLLPATQNTEIQKNEILQEESPRKKKIIYKKDKAPVKNKKTFIAAAIAAILIILGVLAIRLGSKENTGEPVVVPPVNEVVQDTVLKPVENKKDSVVLEKKVEKPTSENESNLSESTPAGKIERKSITFTEKETLISIAGEKIEAEVGYSFEGEFEDGKVVSGKLYDADKNIKKIIFPKRNF